MTPTSNNPSLPITSAIFGGVFWFGLSIFAVDGTYDRILLLSFLVHLPLILEASVLKARDGTHPFSYDWAVILQPFASFLTALAIALKPGPWTGILVLPMVLLGFVLVVYGFGRRLKRGWAPASEAGPEIGYLFLLIAVILLLIMRFGGSFPMASRSDLLFSLSHLLYGGFTGVSIVGLSGRLIPKTNHLFHRWHNGLLIGLIIGTIMLSISPWVLPSVVLIGNILTSVSLFSAAIMMIFFGVKREELPSIGRMVLVAGFIFAITGIVGVIVNRLSIACIVDWQPPLSLLESHGWLHAIGFTTSTLVALVGLNLPNAARRSGVPLLRIPRDNNKNVTFTPYLQKDGSLRGLIPDLTYVEGEDFDPNLVSPKLISFVENTIQYTLLIQTTWSSLGRVLLASNLKKAGVFGKKDPDFVPSINQLIIPNITPNMSHLRHWEYAQGGSLGFFLHTFEANTYFCFSYPTLRGTVTLMMYPSSKDGKIYLDSAYQINPGGDQGIYLAQTNQEVSVPIKLSIVVEEQNDGSEVKMNIQATLMGLPLVHTFIEGRLREKKVADFDGNQNVTTSNEEK